MTFFLQRFLTTLLLFLSGGCHSFTPSRLIHFGSVVRTKASSSSSFLPQQQHQHHLIMILAAESGDGSDGDDELSSTMMTTSTSSSAKLSLEEKMKAWEASEEEIKAATLGGIVPTKREESADRSDAFDVGLYILFPFMVLSGLAFALFPFIMGNLDVDSVGPPPTI